MIKKQKYAAKRVIMLFMITAILMTAYSLTVSAAQEDGVRIHVIDLKSGDVKGDTVLLESRGEYLLIDTGEADNKQQVIKYLKKEGVKKLSIYISHFHSDHVGELMNIINSHAFTIENLYVSERSILSAAVKYAQSDSSVTDSERQRYENTLKKYDGLQAKAGKPYYPENFVVVEKGDSFALGDAAVETLGTPDFKVNQFKNDSDTDPSLTQTKLEHYLNNMSLSTMVTWKSGGKTMKYLSCGDAEAEEEAWLMRQGYNLDCDIFKMNHHGTDTSNSPKFLKKVSAEHAFSNHYVNKAEIARQNAIYKNYNITGIKENSSTVKKSLFGLIRTYKPMNDAKKYGDVYRTEFNGSIVFDTQDGQVIKTSKTGFRSSNGNTYLYVNDKKQTGNADGYITGYCNSLFKVNSQGAIIPGFYKYQGNYYYCNGPYGMAVIGCGFYKVDNKTYYSGEYQSYAATGWKKIDNLRYYFDPKTAVMAQNCVKKAGDNYIYFTKDGLAYKKDGWFTLGDATYYITPGAKSTGKVFTKGLIKIGKYKYYFAKDGKMTVNKKVKVNGSTYYFDKKGMGYKNDIQTK